MLKKCKNKNKALQQRFEILTLAKDLYRKDPSKGIQKMIAFRKANKILPQNEAFVSGSLYLAYSSLEQKRKAVVELESLKLAENPDRFIKFLGL